METKMETIKVIGRTSAAGKYYYQTAIHEEGNEQGRFIPVYLKKGLEKLNYKSFEKKVDKRGQVYDLYEIEKSHVFFPIDEKTNQVEKAMIVK